MSSKFIPYFAHLELKRILEYSDKVPVRVYTLILLSTFWILPSWGNDELLRALEIKDEEKALRFLKSPSTPLKINIQNEQGMTPLMLAFQNEFYDAISLIISKQPNPNLTNDSNETALHFAVRMGDSDYLQSLLELKALKKETIDMQNKYGRTALMYAAMEGYEDSAIMLLEAGARVDQIDGKSMNALHYAVIGNSNSTVKKILERPKDKFRIDLLNQPHGQSPLALAAKKGDREMIQLLLEKGALLNQLTKTLKTPIFYAVINKNKRAFNTLLEAGAKINLSDQLGNTLLHYGAEADNVEILKILAKKLASKINEKNNHKLVPLVMAAEKGLSQNVKILLDVPEVNINLANQEDESVLFILAKKQDYQNIAKLLDGKKYANLYINARNPEGTSVIMQLAKDEAVALCAKLMEQTNLEYSGVDELGNTLAHLMAALDAPELMIKVISSKSFDPNAKNKAGKTPLMVAFNAEYQPTIDILKGVPGIDFELEDNFGRTLLHAGLKNGKPENVQWVIDQSLKVNPQIFNKKDKQEKTPLMSAAISGTPETVEKIVSIPGINLDETDKEGLTPLLIALQNKNFKIAKVLLKAGADPKAGDSPDFNPYTVDELYEDEEIMNKMVENTGKNIHYAFVDALNAKVPDNVVRIFFENGALANYRIPKGEQSSWTTLHIAASNGDADVLKIFLERPEVEINARTSNGMTPLIAASMRGEWLAIRELVRANANPNILMRKLEKAGALHFASLAADKNPRDTEEGEDFWKTRYGKSVEELLKSPNIKVNQLDAEGNSPLLNACHGGNTIGAKALIEKKAVVDEENNKGVTPMMYAVTHGDQELVEALLEKRANFDGETDYGWTVFRFAIENSVKQEFVEFLIQKGLSKGQARRAINDSSLLESKQNEIREWIE